MHRSDALVIRSLWHAVPAYAAWTLVAMALCLAGTSPAVSTPGAAEPTAAHSQRPPAGADALVQLGRMMFFDRGLSRDGTISCASCHQPDKAFTDGKPRAEGIGGQRGTRNTPSLRLAAFAAAQFWDGRRPTLEAQVLDPFLNPREHGLQDVGEVLRQMRARTEYGLWFQRALAISPHTATPDDIARALGAYVHSLKLTDTPLDRYLFRGDQSALTGAERRGLAVFRGQAGCSGCHLIGDREAPLTDGKFHSVAIGLERIAPILPQLTRQVAATPRAELTALVSSDPDVAALGRFVVTLTPADIGRFKTPSLRNVASTAPYMHDGSVASLEEAVERELYYRGRERGRPVVMSLAETADLLAFLKGLKDIPATLPPPSR